MKNSKGERPLHMSRRVGGRGVGVGEPHPFERSEPGQGPGGKETVALGREAKRACDILRMFISTLE